ncbi:MAG TPA: xylulose kinase, partial [Nocardioides sp.]|nr:xylulose kinase [Nocardioides sp.]
MPLVLGIDSSTQSSKAVLVDADEGVVVDEWTAPPPAGTEVDPRAWLTAVDTVAAPLLDRAA